MLSALHLFPFAQYEQLFTSHNTSCAIRITPQNLNRNTEIAFDFFAIIIPVSNRKSLYSFKAVLSEFRFCFISEKYVSLSLIFSFVNIPKLWTGNAFAPISS